MSIKPPLTDLPIKTADRGFYSGFSVDVTVSSKLAVGGLVLWAVAFPEQAGAVLAGFNSFILSNFAIWYVYVMAAFVIACLGLALWPAAARLKLGEDHDKPEFSRFSWFSMMFGAGIGVGMLTWAVAEPIYHFNTNPDVIQGFASSKEMDNYLNAYKWSYLHWGFTAWASYAIAGLGLGFFAYRRGLPLTIRSSLAPLFGERLSGPLGHVIDIVAVIATILGVAQMLGFGVEQFVSGMARIGIGDWLLNMVLSTFLLGFFLIFGSTWFGLNALFGGFWTYVTALPEMIFTVYQSDGSDVGDKLVGWQGGWTVFYWAWWVAFAPFVGLFLARISKGRTVREFVVGAAIAPAIMCFVWFSFAGGTAIDLELNGTANGAIFSVPDGDKIFAMTDLMLSPVLSWLRAVLIVVLLMTYLVTSADSAVLIVNTINAAGDEGPKARPHILFWGAALGLVVGVLLLVGGLKAIQTAMEIGALPFSIVMVLMCIALFKAIYRDGMRERVLRQAAE